VHKNAIDDVIRAMVDLPDHVKFVIFGSGPDETMLKSLAASLGVANRVLFRGQIGHEEMPRYLKACDIFIRPSRSEGMGNSFVEAMAAELPVIATQAGGIADFLFDAKRNPEQGTTGWAVDVDSPEQIRLAVEDIMNHPEKVAAVVARAKAMAVDKYDWDLVAKRMRDEVFQPLFEKE
jgi:glycosyltransferase involved in cell wall biosynthesis